jgi:cytochrome b pre-mRNA-processing protein 3
VIGGARKSMSRQRKGLDVMLWRGLLRGRREETGIDRLYRAIVAAGRDPAWYLKGGVPDTVDGRFDMIAALLALVLLRLEADGDACRDATVRLAETFIDDMNGNLRQIGIGDLVVGKHVTRMMGALGGRLGAFRDAAADGDLVAPVRRNIFREHPPSDEALAFVADRLAGFRHRLKDESSERLEAGELPCL